MSRLLSLALAAWLCAAAFSSAQERTKKKKADFPTTHAAALKQWEAEQYGACLESLRELSGLVSLKRVESILAALPAPPEGFTVANETKLSDMEANPMAAVTSLVGNAVERTYRGEEASIEVNVAADSPMTQMFSMWVANPKLIGPEAELVKYGPHNAILKKEGNQWSLQALIHEKHLVEVKVTGRDDEFLLGFFDQAAVDALARVLGN